VSLLFVNLSAGSLTVGSLAVLVQTPLINDVLLSLGLANSHGPALEIAGGEALLQWALVVDDGAELGLLLLVLEELLGGLLVIRGIALGDSTAGVTQVVVGTSSLLEEDVELSLKAVELAALVDTLLNVEALEELTDLSLVAVNLALLEGAGGGADPGDEDELGADRVTAVVGLGQAKEGVVDLAILEGLAQL